MTSDNLPIVEKDQMNEQSGEDRATSQHSTIATFPRDFLWGSATAAHQVEGNNRNSDWWDWEQAGRCKNAQRSGDACDQYHRFRDDFALLKELHQNAHRLSIEWARIEPRPAEFDRAELDHYRAVLTALRDLGIEPVVTLHHFTIPRWLAQRGGWANPDVVRLFTRYVTKVVEELGDLVRYWVTINEPNFFAAAAYLQSQFPPGQSNPVTLMRVVANLVRAHGHAYHAIHLLYPEARVGVAHHWRLFDPYHPKRLDRWVAGLRHELFNRAFPRMLVDGVLRFPFGFGQIVPEARDSQDFLGINYYTREFDRFSIERPFDLFAREVVTTATRDACGAEIYPEGFERTLREAAQFGKPILVTENGVADQADELRPAFLVSHLLALHHAMQAGVPVIGYLHWTSLDNFEWNEGYNLRFGLIAVDFATLERRIKPSGHLYAEICRTGSITAEQVNATRQFGADSALSPRIQLKAG